MKKFSYPLIVILTIFSSAVIIPSFKAPEKSNVGTIGDVKYSVLPPAEFIKQNGSGWELLQGQILDKTSGLFNVLQDSTLPDARGVFIRGVNAGRRDGMGEVDRSRKPFSYQSDTFASHTHSLTDISGDNYIIRGSDNNGGYTATGLGGTQLTGYFYYPRPNISQIGSTGGVETRPRNISLYVYVKIN